VQFISTLGVGPPDVIGSSYGAYTVLFLVLRRPDLVYAAVLSEPPIISWLPAIPEAKLRRCRRVVIQDAAHEMWSEQPDQCRERAIEFFEEVSSGFWDAAETKR
jgi:pimeloyl-ACP methyl ester carboxylesterase